MVTGFNSLVEAYLGSRLPQALASLINFGALPPDAQAIIRRMLELMRRAEYPITEFNPQMIELLSTVTPGMLPSAWGGRIPPLTASGRHRKLDVYIARESSFLDTGDPLLIDLVCGFPPLTTVDTAKHLHDWFVLGVDRSFARYVLYDPDGRYACFDSDGIFLYFQSPQIPLRDTPQQTRERFKAFFAELHPRLGTPDKNGRAEVSQKGYRLICNHVLDFEMPNLQFLEADLENLHSPSARVIRCMNVLLYFEKNARNRMRQKIGALIEPEGVLIEGFNHPFGIYARYMVYFKKSSGLLPNAFAFSLDNLRPLGIGPWLALEDNDEQVELLADLTGAIRRDTVFWPEFNRRVDSLQEKIGICSRGKDGYNYFTEKTLTEPPQTLMKKTSDLWQQIDTEGGTDAVVEALSRAGYRAWKNRIGDIAVEPPEK